MAVDQTADGWDLAADHMADGWDLAADHMAGGLGLAAGPMAVDRTADSTAVGRLADDWGLAFVFLVVAAAKWVPLWKTHSPESVHRFFCISAGWSADLDTHHT